LKVASSPFWPVLFPHLFLLVFVSTVQVLIFLYLLFLRERVAKYLLWISFWIANLQILIRFLSLPFLRLLGLFPLLCRRNCYSSSVCSILYCAYTFILTPASGSPAKIHIGSHPGCSADCAEEEIGYGDGSDGKQ
jgi:hypothetical protein